MSKQTDILLEALAKIKQCGDPECKLWIRNSFSGEAFEIPTDDDACQNHLEDLIVALLQRELADADKVRERLEKIDA